MGFLGGGGGGGKSESGNHAWGAIERIYKPMAERGVGGFNMMGNVLGLGGPGASSQALDDYYNSSGGKFLLDQGLDGLTSRFAAQGLSKSGAAQKGMEQYRQDLASTKLDNYLGHLGQYSQLGLGAGGLMANAGQFSKSSGQGGGGGGLGSIIGSVISTLPFILPSDEALKENIVDLGFDMGGVPAISFTYRDGFDLPQGSFVGVRAQDAERLRPDALGPRWKGFLTVNYSKLKEPAR